MSFLNLAMLMGLVAVAIPPIIHLLNRRRYEIVDWGAMQFLQVSEVTRRRILIEEMLLMLLRMGLIAILVLALAQPFSDQTILSPGGRPNRDVVLVFDGSASLSFKQGDQSTHEEAKKWATTFVEELKPGDSVAIIVARKQPVVLLPKLTADRVRVRDMIQRLPPPAGGANLSRAVNAAYSILEGGQHPERDVIVISDGQRYGMGDDRSLQGWEDLKTKRDAPRELKPNLWFVNLDPKRIKNPPNWALAPLVTSRAIVAPGERLRFRSAIVLTGAAKYQQPYTFRGEIDGQAVELEDEKGKPFKLPDEKLWSGGQVTLEFWVTAPAKVGSHLFSLVIEPDPPSSKQPNGYIVKDHLPLDNQRDIALEVLKSMPVLLVDGDDKPEAKYRGSDFLEAALAPRKDTNPLFKVRVVPIQDFNAVQVRNPDPNNKDGEEKPRVIILSNVAKLSQPQQQLLETFLNEGGGVLMTLGDRAEPDVYNRQFHREGKGWFPARLDKVLGDNKEIAKAARLLAESFYHPAVERFRNSAMIRQAYFARWWKLVPPENQDRGSPIARLDRNEAPFLVEGKRGEGRIIVCAVPLDDSWLTNAVKDRGAGAEFVRLSHELVYYLADARASDHNVEPGQPLRYRLPRDASSSGLTLRSPIEPEPRPLVIDGEEDDKTYNARLIQQNQGQLVVHEGLNEAGVWRLTTGEGETIHYVVQPDGREADLTPIDDEDKKKIGEFAAFQYEDDAKNLVVRLSLESKRAEFWWWFLLGVVLLLCSEVWLTRRIVKNRT